MTESTTEELCRRWAQWVSEVDRGELLTEDEWLAVYWTRDELEDALHILPPELARRLAEQIDPLDERYAKATIASDAAFGRTPKTTDDGGGVAYR